MKKIHLQIPATSANCGPGYDVLGLACSFYNEAIYEITDNYGFQLEVTGEGEEYLKPFGRNLAFSSFFRVWNEVTDGQRIGLKITMVNRIPMSRGLGSSSAAIVAGVMAANYLSDARLSKSQLLNYANDIEGHPDNVAPAIYGNFTISFIKDKIADCLVLKPVKPIKFVAVVPEFKLSTAEARRAIPETVPNKDAVFNTSRASLLVGSLLSGNYEYLATALEDKLHQPYRKHLIPGLEDVFTAAKKAGAYNAIISGAGSTVMAYVPCDGDCEKIGSAMQNAFEKKGVKSVYHIFDLDTEGAKAI
ncbi:MAG: homoserine kinase [Phascolarctobacterium sp.]|nr:homoserine kinase [Candidatus Phascolarctobacterium caballi]